MSKDKDNIIDLLTIRDVVERPSVSDIADFIMARVFPFGEPPSDDELKHTFPKNSLLDLADACGVAAERLRRLTEFTDDE